MTTERLSAFDGTNLPDLDIKQDISTDETVDDVIKLTGGKVYRAGGTDRGEAELPKYYCRGTIVDTNMAAVLTTVDGLKAKRGKVGSLVKTMADASTRSRTALCEVAREYNGLVTFQSQEIELIFQCLTPGWKGAAESVTATLNANPKTLTLPNAGNRRITNAIITIAVPGGATPITALTLLVAGVTRLDWAGTIAAGTSMVIDCGARTILNNGVNAFSGLTRHSSHVVEDWLRIEPTVGGTSTLLEIHTALTGNTATGNVAYNDGWE